MPLKIASQSSNRYTAASLATRAEAVACGRPPIEHVPPWLWHRRFNCLRTSGALLIHPMSFFTVWPCLLVWPYWHWSPTVLPTCGWASSSWMQSTLHDDAALGCSCKRIPASLQLSHVQFTAKSQVHLSGCLPPTDFLVRPAVFDLVEELPCAEDCTRRASKKERRLLSGQWLTSLLAHVFSSEIPMLAFFVCQRQV